MDVLKRIRELLDKYGWSAYRLSVESGIPQSTLSNMFSRNNLPSIPTLEAICGGFNMTLSEFFEEEEHCGKLTEEQSRILKKYSVLNKEQKRLMEMIMDNMK